MTKRNDLSGCTVILPTGICTYAIVVKDEYGKNVVCIDIKESANTSVKFKKMLARIIKAAIPKG